MEEHEDRRALNPFVLPPETNTLFTMLVFAALVLVLGLGNILTFPLVVASGGVIEDNADPLAMLGSSDVSPAEGQRLIERFLDEAWWATPLFCIGLSVPLGMTALIVGGTVIHHRFHGWRIIRRRKLARFTTEKDQALSGAVEALTKQVQVEPPQIYMEKDSQKTDGQVWGFRKRFAMRLSNGMRLLLRKKPAEFNAIVLHELAHIANGDIIRTYFAQSLWVMVIVILFLLFGAAGLGLSLTPMDQIFNDVDPALGFVGIARSPMAGAVMGASFGLLFLAQFLGLAGAIAIIRASILRTRELYADWRAASWGARDSLAEIVSRTGGQPAFWRRPFLLHPTARERVENLQDVTRLFRTTWVIPFFSGFLVAYSLYGLAAVIVNGTYAATVLGDIFLVVPIVMANQAPELSAMTSVLMSIVSFVDSTFRFLSVTVFAIGIGSLVTGTLGVQAQRQVLSDLAQERGNALSYLRAGIPAGQFALGMTVAVALMFGPLAVWFLVAAPVIAALVWLFLLYVRFFSVRLFRMHQGGKAPGASAWLIRTAAGITLILTFFSALGGPVGALVSFVVQMQQQATAFWEENPELLESVRQTMRDNPTISMLDVIDQYPELGEMVQSILREYRFPTFWALVLSIIFISVTYSLIFGVTWMGFALWRAVAASRCNTCHQVRIRSVFNARTCPSCGAEWTKWAYVESV